MMQEAILNFPRQFEFEPKIANKKNLKKTKKFLLCGMGGSHLSADLLLAWDKSLDLRVHCNYDLPNLPDIKDRLVVLSSYSGNTEEVISSYRLAKKMKLKMAVLATDGQLIKLATKDQVPFVQLPDTGIQPRSALGFSTIALAEIFGLSKAKAELARLSTTLNVAGAQKQGVELSKLLYGSVPVIYSSEGNQAIAYNWKIKLNETGKIPAFYNVLPELNHNEMTGFDFASKLAGLTNSFFFIFLSDKKDHPKVQKRMRVTQEMYKKRGLRTKEISLSGAGFGKIFDSLLLADWLAVFLAEKYGLESEQVPMVEEFKRLIK